MSYLLPALVHDIQRISEATSAAPDARVVPDRQQRPRRRIRAAASVVMLKASKALAPA